MCRARSSACGQVSLGRDRSGARAKGTSPGCSGVWITGGACVIRLRFEEAAEPARLRRGAVGAVVVDEHHLPRDARERRRANRTVDTAAHDEQIERALDGQLSPFSVALPLGILCFKFSF